MFATEIELSSVFKEILPKSEWKNYIYWEEVKGLLGIPDYILVQKEKNVAIGFELKLANWKRAMVQAFKYRTFCEQSYVILDDAHLKPAITNISEFVKFNIGLASINKSNKKLEIHHKPKSEVPFSSDLKERLNAKLYR